MEETILTDEELLQVLKHGVWVKLPDLDKEYRCYKVLDFNKDELLICYSGIDWGNGETWYRPHAIYQNGKNNTWFFEKPTKEEDLNKETFYHDY